MEGVVESDFDRLNSRAKCLKGVSEVDEKEQGDDSSSIFRGLKFTIKLLQNKTKKCIPYLLTSPFTTKPFRRLKFVDF